MTLESYRIEELKIVITTVLFFTVLMEYTRECEWLTSASDNNHKNE